MICEPAIIYRKRKNCEWLRKLWKGSEQNRETIVCSRKWNVHCLVGAYSDPAKNKGKRVQADRNKGEWITLHYKDRDCAYSWQEANCPTRSTSAISSSSTMSSSKRFEKDKLQHIANVVLQQFQQQTNRRPVVSVCTYFHLPEIPCLSSPPYSVFNTRAVLRAHSSWYCSHC